MPSFTLVLCKRVGIYVQEPNYVRRCLVHSYFSLCCKHKMFESWQRPETENSRRGKGIERNSRVGSLRKCEFFELDSRNI